ncbi:MAG: tyrosine-protein phosphatase [Clostridiales bacterium]|nr:tyrosine-protein phosphatase [Clostridiales bacterium]
MKIELEKVANARDLGGIKSNFGIVKYSKLLRSGHLGVASEKDVAKLTCEHKLRRIVDLRTATEIANNPDVTIDGVEWVNVSIIAATTFGITFEKLDGATIAKMIDAGIARMAARGETPTDHLRILYKNFAHDDYSHRGYGKFLKLLANEPIDGATLWHCSAGKDRVGTCTALLLHCLGVGRDDIMRDYMLTNEMNRDHSESILNKIRPYVSDEVYALEKRILMVDESYLNCFFDEVEKQFGSVDAFITHCGVSDDDIAKLRSNYLE